MEGRFDFKKNVWVRPARPETLDAAEPPCPGRWNRPPVKRPLSRRDQIVIVVGASVFVGLCALDRSFLPLLIIATLFLCYFPHVAAAYARSTSPEDISLFEDPDDLEVCLVAMEVMVEGKSVGQDRGLVWFTDGRLFYSGHRTSFVLGGEDVLPEPHWKRLTDPTTHAQLPELAVPLNIYERAAYVKLEPIRKGGDVADRQEYRFLKRLYNFRLYPQRSEGPRQWPPLLPWNALPSDSSSIEGQDPILQAASFPESNC